MAVICSCYHKSLHQSGFQRDYLYQGQIRQGDSYAKCLKSTVYPDLMLK